ncbi:MAG: HPr(Ser) kinase/phosphatase, partial [Gammaproteobacteria bacterium]|nr:HPr(Ser) kinase/phosphatase [Gammaproteobacteria bacterium]
MSISLSIREFHQRFQKRLQLSFVSGQVGMEKEIHSPSKDSGNYETADFLNLIRPASVAVIGVHESNYLASMSSENQHNLLGQLFRQSVCSLILSQRASLSNSTIKFCSKAAIAIFRSELEDTPLLSNLRYFLNQALSETTTMHGVFIEVYSVGTLIVGDSGVGKSELALSLISRGHRLIADDIVQFSRLAPGVIDGIHPGLSNDFIEVRGVGILNIRAMFGSNALRRNKTLRMIVNMIHYTSENSHQFDRLGDTHKTRAILGTEIPEMTLPVSPGRNLTVLVEAA